MTPLLETNLDGIAPYSRGKVRDVYAAGEHLLIVATDRISAFDYILQTGIPRKGEVLTQMSLFWFKYFAELVPNHFVTADTANYPAEFQPFAEQLRGRSMLVKKLRMLPVECVARGYLSGSGWKEYLATGGVCGIPLPSGLHESDKLPEPIFTPATKAESGHDENISFDAVVSMIGRETAEAARRLTLQLYAEAADYAATKGILIADTKFEFGWAGDVLTLGDEVLTPDSSRFWPQETYSPGKAQYSFDKQYVRDYLESIRWNKLPPAPALPDDVALKTSEKYREAYRLLSGRTL